MAINGACRIAHGGCVREAELGTISGHRPARAHRLEASSSTTSATRPVGVHYDVGGIA
jgi:hypothetical protein